MPHPVKERKPPARSAPATARNALLNRFKSYLLEKKMCSVAELFLNSYGLLATKASTQLRRIESNIAFVPGSNPLWKRAVGATLAVAHPVYCHPDTNPLRLRSPRRYPSSMKNAVNGINPIAHFGLIAVSGDARVACTGERFRMG